MNTHALKKFEVFDTETMGLGIKSLEDIEANRFIFKLDSRNIISSRKINKC